jgi:hypothetical protein
VRRIQRKAYRPGPTSPGEPISWVEPGPDGFPIARTGVVWSKAPAPRCVWVVPDDGRDAFVQVRVPAEGEPRSTGAMSHATLRTLVESHERRWGITTARPAMTGTDSERK